MVLEGPPSLSLPSPPPPPPPLSPLPPLSLPYSPFPTEQISRTLAAKAALAIRYDALGEDESTEVGRLCRAKVESRVMEIEQGQVRWQHTYVRCGGV